MRPDTGNPCLTRSFNEWRTVYHDVSGSIIATAKFNQWSRDTTRDDRRVWFRISWKWVQQEFSRLGLCYSAFSFWSDTPCHPSRNVYFIL